MRMPQLNGNLCHSNFFIFAACDEHYFDDFAPGLVNSIKANTAHRIHLHIFNPRADQLDFCHKNDVSVSYEHVSLNLFAPAADKWLNEHTEETLKNQRLRTLTAMSKGNDYNIQDRMRKTYYACARFIRLQELVSDQSFFAIDVDALVRKSITISSDRDLTIHFVPGKKSRFLAGGIHGSEKTLPFLKEYSARLNDFIEQDYIYWGLDQDLLDEIVPKYNWCQLPETYIDWNMRVDSAVWTAKGTRKNLQVFLTEKKKYTS